jgi:hypothetical protein
MSTEIKEATVDQEVAEIAKASLTNLQKNRENLENLAAKYKGITIEGIADKENYKLVTAGITATRTARTTIEKLVKAGKSNIDAAKKLVDGEGAALIGIVQPIELFLKNEKERIDKEKELIAERDKQQAEEKKQLRIAKIFANGLEFNGSHYKIGDCSITPVQVAEFSDTQFDGFIAQAAVEFETVQIAKQEQEEQAEAQRLATEKQLEVERLEKEDLLRERTDTRISFLVDKGFLWNEAKEQFNMPGYSIKMSSVTHATKNDWEMEVSEIEEHLISLNKKEVENIPPPIIETYVAPVVITREHVEVTPEPLSPELEEALSARAEDQSSFLQKRPYTATMFFNSDLPFHDTKIGKATIRIYVEEFMDEANAGLTKEQIFDSGNLEGSSDLLYLIIK